MARHALGPATFAVVKAVEGAWGGEDVVAACSGGSDSLALALAAGILASRRPFSVRAVVVDHRLQPGSDAWARQAAEVLGGRGIPTSVVGVDVINAGSGLEAAARRARYTALESSLSESERCYLGHTLDDQAESVLLGLARGSGTRSLAGMATVRGRFVRPLLALRSATTAEACRELHAEWHDDPHNNDVRFARVRVRRRVLPLLEEQLGPGIAEALARTAEIAAEDADALDALADEAGDEIAVGPGLDCRALAGLLPAVRRRVIRRWLLGAGAGEASRAHVLAVDALVWDWRGQKGVDVPDLRIVRADGRLTIAPRGGDHG